MTAATFVGVRHHSPACARLVRKVIAELRPAHVLVEGPADMNSRMDELLLDHDLPVDLVFMLLSPVDAGAEHLKALARVSRRLRDRTFLAKLRGAGSRDALYALFTADAVRDAA